MKKRKIIIYIMFFVFGILEIIDLIFTFYGLNLFGVWIEANGLVKYLFIKNIPFIWIILKFVRFIVLLFVAKMMFKLDAITKDNKFFKIFGYFLFIVFVIILSTLILEDFDAYVNWMYWLFP